MAKITDNQSDTSENKTDSRYKIVILDDQPIFCEGVKRLVDQDDRFKVVGIFDRKAPAFRFIASEQPTLMLMELNLRQEVGLEILKDARAEFEWLKVLVFSDLDERVYGERTILAGARGYLMKNSSKETLIKVIDTIIRDEVFLSEEVKASVLKRMYLGNQPKNNSHADPITSLSDREFEVFDLIGRGKGTREIADTLMIGIKTVENHREKIKKKLGLTSGSGLVHYATIWMHDMAIGTNQELKSEDRAKAIAKTIQLPSLVDRKAPRQPRLTRAI